MDELYSPNCTEYTYEKKPSGIMKLARVLLVIGYILFALLFFLFCYKTRLLPLFAVCPLFTWMLVFFTWRYVSFDVYYSFERAELEFGKVQLKRKRQARMPIGKISVREAARIARYSDVDRVTLPKRMCDLTSPSDATEQIVVVYNERGRTRAVILEATPKLLKLLKSYSDELK